jgi:hypothetical protein
MATGAMRVSGEKQGACTGRGLNKESNPLRERRGGLAWVPGGVCCALLLAAGCSRAPNEAGGTPLLKPQPARQASPASRVARSAAPVQVQGLGPLPLIAGEIPVYAVVSVYMAASAQASDRSLMTKLKVEGFASHCPGRIVELATWWRQAAIRPPPGDPAVIVAQDSLCFRVPVNSPSTLVGTAATSRPASLYVVNGEEYLGADPDQLEGAGASFFIPGARGGYQVGVFAVAGVLESPLDAARSAPVAVVGFSAVWLDQMTEKDHFLLTTVSPEKTQFNVGLTVWAGADGKVPAHTLPGVKYQLDVDAASVDESTGALSPVPVEASAADVREASAAASAAAK